MKRFTAVVIAVSLCLYLAACGSSAPAASSAAPVSSAAPAAESKPTASSAPAPVSEPAKAEPKPAPEAEKPGSEIRTASVKTVFNGVPAGGVIECFLFDALNEVHIDLQKNSASGSGSTEFVFEAESITPPFTFSAGINANGEYSNNVHVDIELV